MFTAVRYFIWYIILVCFLACASITHFKVAPGAKKYYNSYISLIQINCPTLKYNKPGYMQIQFGKLAPPVIGMCEIGSNWFTITLDSKFWEVSDEDDRYQLAMHELTHCLLGLGHVDKRSHYMSPELEKLKKRETTNQVIEIIREQCHK